VAEVSIRQTLEATPESPAVARRWAGAALRRYDLPAPAVDRAEMIVSELATNAVVHTGAPFTVELEIGETTLLIKVFDENTTLPHVIEPDPLGQGGRGLFLVSALSEDWGAEQLDDDTKVVWSEVEHTAAPPFSER
jgi:anti-sigma regulatory factor (Ser/Thr protein kinase)